MKQRPPRTAGLDAYEFCYIGLGWSIDRISSRYGVAPELMLHVLIGAGLEVDGQVKPGYMTQREAERWIANKRAVAA